MRLPSLPRLLILSAALASLAGCTGKGGSTPAPAATDAGTARSQPPASPSTAQEQQSGISERARQLHAQGRKHGEAGEFELALRYFHEAELAAPTWPLPLYDMGLTFLYIKADDKALETFTKLDAVAPQGLAGSKRILDSLRREQDGRVPPGTLHEFLAIQQLKDDKEVRRQLQALTQKAPGFVPAWQELAYTEAKPEEAEKLIAKALSLEPDAAARGSLLVYKATVMWRRGEADAARKLLRELLADPTTLPDTAAEAKELLSIPDGLKP
jgi:tetratricopeptide (TPR) repeat protein